MKIEISIEKEGSHGEGEDKKAMMDKALANGKKMQERKMMQERVAKMLAKMAGRKKPEMIDMEAAADFVEDNEEYKKGM